MSTAYRNEYPTLEQHFTFRGEMDLCPRVILPFHRRVFGAVADWALGILPEGRRHLAVNIPPGHGKTFIAHDTVAWLTGLFPDSQWIYASYSAQLAIAQTCRIREIMASDWYAKVYPAARIRQGQSTQRYFETVSGGHVYGVGIDGTVTGFRAGRKRPEFGGGIIIDDPIKPTDARSETVRGGTNRWFTETLLSRRNHDDTPILLIMQRLHEEDLVGHVCKTMPGEWEVLSIPALDEATGEMLWTETFSRKTAEVLRAADPATFYAQYQQSPVPPGGNMIKLGWWRTYQPGTEPRGSGLIFLTADTAYKEKKDADASVIRAWLGTPEHLYCLDAVYGRWDFPRLLEEAERFWARWESLGAREFWVEDKASGTPLVQTLCRNGVPAHPWKPSEFGFPEDKVGRMNEAAWVIHGGRVLLPAGDEGVSLGDGAFLRLEPGARVLAEECAAFSPDMSHAHDDHCDTLTMAVSLWRHAGGRA